MYTGFIWILTACLFISTLVWASIVCLNVGRNLSQAIKMLYFTIKSFCVFLRLWLLLLVSFGNAALHVSGHFSAEETVEEKKRNPYYKNTLCKFKQKQQSWGLWCNCFPNISDAKPIQFSLIHVMPVHTSSCLRVIYIFQSLVRSLLVLAFLPGIHRQDLYCKVRTLQN